MEERKWVNGNKFLHLTVLRELGQKVPRCLHLKKKTWGVDDIGLGDNQQWMWFVSVGKRDIKARTNEDGFHEMHKGRHLLLMSLCR